MDRDDTLQRVTDALCGEFDQEGEKELQAALSRDSSLAAEARQLKRVWQRLGIILDEEQPEQAVLDRVFDRILRQAPAELSDEDLDLAAGGTSAPECLPKPKGSGFDGGNS